MSKIVLQLFVFILLLQSCQLGYSLQSKWPKRGTWRDERSYDFMPVKKGYVVNINHDTTIGLVKLVHPWAIPILPENKNHENDIIKVKLDSVESLSVYYDTTIKKETKYVNISYKSTLWRLLAKQNNIAIYDNNYPATNYNVYYGKTILVTGIERVKLFTYIGYISRLGNTKPLLLKFVRKRYGTNTDSVRFKDKQEVIEYILKKENEKTQMEIKVNVTALGKP